MRKPIYTVASDINNRGGRYGNMQGWTIVLSTDYYQFTDCLSLSLSEDLKVTIVIDSDLTNFIPLNHFFFTFSETFNNYSIFSSKMIYLFQYFSNVNKNCSCVYTNMIWVDSCIICSVNISTKKLLENIYI